MIELQPRHLAVVQEILATHLSDREVWAFGSRVHGRGLKPFSDLDLAILGDTPLDLGRRAVVGEAFSHSDLPFRVDVVDWATADAAFRAVIERDHVVLQVPHVP